MAATSKLEEEILKATGLSPEKGESRSDFLDRLANHLDDNKLFTDEQYKALSKPAQDWTNKASSAISNKKPIPEFPGEETGTGRKAASAPAPAKEADVEEEVVPDKKKKATAKAAAKTQTAKDNKVAKTGDLKKAATGNGEAVEAKPAKKKKAKTPKAAKEPKEPKERKLEGKSADLKRLILAKPDRTNAELEEMMKKKGHDISMSTLSSIRASFLHSMRVIEKAGRLSAA